MKFGKKYYLEIVFLFHNRFSSPGILRVLIIKIVDLTNFITINNCSHLEWQKLWNYQMHPQWQF